ncbi:MAG: single-stranded-DNA-specific exonuclease RecJ [Candidatus Sungbacteria bacterium RIFCSPLOWO2_02_FULL_51_17]|uniref:Single-stranded-DNA-specific exonuclease RecJ n=1 Tax=Candidatus Sungbacteria bacterium RIFCSPHIGHO2_02_FULL_51_29 TaxID=1802273 RepID=A0A1G2KSP2_9BACT|nr:MAG: single-stranded-DNA-specific exonuclease RecJ [Candidatus Sungbacteria bacterium RIFCSPHIGHO2_01_FULL_51_22]OHA02465.1 MAG: single-stranded-DNA-specific exonuclease RecJ [Candidatus Sungbacteria bacterium RIFCSPHIGHO2_02_FULL_51_29]OHA06741.1 MAG: single-stranded-DNA-specific exonuclease RecJ [Candidatus Sungbacteria bacterium RIFCSPLOWO2_01_FULL_51_34]OHA11957.1 MAG: single-stranded-DNA-specific exonuclease RecJ [Candidatus Sungbacteria bacterium RIFCSPLOWO2_02_FULL_51_17]
MSIFVNTSQWIVKPSPPEEFVALVRKNFSAEGGSAPGGQVSISQFQLLAQLLWSRGLKTEAEVDKFLNPDYAKHTHDPFLFKGMDKAVARLISAIEKKEKIIVFADYDADGVDGAAILCEFLKKVGAEYSVFIPDRFKEAYGLSMARIDEFHGLGAKVIVTIDCGVTDFNEIEKANEYGTDVIVCDHHLVPPRWPNAYAIIDHKQEDDTYPEKVLSGAGLAFKIVEAVLKRWKHPDIIPGWEKWLLDCVAIAAIADMVPITGENRVYVKYGIDVMKKMRRPGLRALLRGRDILPGRITQETIGFTIAPRINAASRMDHANTAFELLMTENIAEAEWLSRRLEEKNLERRSIVEKILITLDERLKNVSEPRIIFEGSSDWPAGVLGIAANRILEKYHCPVFLYAMLPGVIKGSCRGPEGMNIVDFMRTAEGHFTDFGGHAQAGGFSLLPEKVLELKSVLEAGIVGIEYDAAAPKHEADAALSMEEVNRDTFNIVQRLQPFGFGNLEPVFLFQDVEIQDMRHVGSDGTHVKMKLGPQGIGAIYFRASHNGFKQRDRLDMLATLQENEWNGNSTIELRVVDAIKRG